MVLRSEVRPGRPAALAAARDIAVSCRVRLARNLQGVRFPDWADEKERLRVMALLGPSLVQENVLCEPTLYRMDHLDETARALMCERHLVSRELAERGPGGAVVFSRDETLSVMINEEDHLRIQAIVPGMDLNRAWANANAVDLALEEHHELAFHKRLGYLTACPSNVGTGMRVSVMVHLLGLRMTNELDAVLRALERLRLTVRGVNGEGSEAAGHLFQVSNQETLGADETQVIDNLQEVVGDLVQQERNARLRLLRKTPEMLLDCVARAQGILCGARVMDADEAVDYLSALRLGVSMGMLKRITIRQLDQLAVEVQPGHLQKRAGKRLEPRQRDMVRASLMRQLLKPVLVQHLRLPE
jgi:protein arginine kinase